MWYFIQEITHTIVQHPSVGEENSEENEEYFCIICGAMYEEETVEPEVWVECDLCNKWLHCSCAGLSCPPPPEENFIRVKCLQ